MQTSTNKPREIYVTAVEFLKAYRWQSEIEEPLVETEQLRQLLVDIWLPLYALLTKEGYDKEEIEDALLFAEPEADIFSQIDILVAEAASIAFNRELGTSISLAEKFGALVRAAGFTVDEII